MIPAIYTIIKVSFFYSLFNQYSLPPFSLHAVTIFSNFLCLESVQLLHLHYAVFEFLVNLWDALETYPDALALFTHLAILYHPQVVVLAALEHSSNFVPRFLHIRLKLKVHHVLLTGASCHLGASMLIRQQVLCQDILPDID